MKTITFFYCLILAGCQILSNESQPAAERGLVLRAGESFGECLGYCRHELTLEQNSLVMISSGWEISGQIPDKKTVGRLDSEQRSALLGLLDLAAFERLEEQYGCPDCADGGAEWLEIERQGHTKRVTFEYGFPPSSIETIADTLRVIRSELRSHL